MKLVILLVFAISLLLSDAATQTTQQQQYNARSSRRERNLDHWDATALAFYLGLDESTGKQLPHHEYPGYDAAVLFYAQWCQNCHAFAPIWDAIATHLHAGSASSKLVMAVFDCEFSAKHSQLCNAAGVQHYPTLLFIGDGTFHDSDVLTRTLLGKKRSAGPAGPSPIPHTIKFQGTWQYADSVLDWIRLMQGFSKWHQWSSSGILHYVRNGLLGFLRPQRLSKKKTIASLPIGVPSTMDSTSTTSSVDVSLLETKLKQSEETAVLMEKAATHAGLLLDSILLASNTTTSTNDVFTVLNDMNAWNATKTTNAPVVSQVVRSCTLELSLDYCSRLTTHVTNAYLDEMANETEFPSMAEIESLLQTRIATQEPYCGTFDECLQQDFVPEKCRPSTCPFQHVACRYVNACLDTSIQREYAIALELVTESQEYPPPPPPESATTTNDKKKGSWGLK
jgi:thiol-disulfide isomerase/thioredoxin